MSTASSCVSYGIVIRHPESARFFDRPIQRLRAQGHDVHVFVREHRSTTDVLKKTGHEYELLAHEASSTVSLVAGHAAFEARLARAAYNRDIDVLTSIGGRAITHVAPLVGADSVVFADWTFGPVDVAVAHLADAVYAPAFADTPSGITTYIGFHELSYLHPEYFEPEPEIVSELGIDPDAPFVVVGFEAVDEAASRRICGAIPDQMAVVPSHETDPLPVSTDTPSVSHTQIFDVLAVADCYIGDSGTMATEAAVLGTPAIRVRRSEMPPEARCIELQDDYSLLYTTDDDFIAADRVASLLGIDRKSVDWDHRHRYLLEETQDVGKLVTDRLLEAGGSETTQTIPTKS